MIRSTTQLLPSQRKTYWSDVFQIFLRDRFAWISGVIVILIVMTSLLAPWICPYDPYQGSMSSRLQDIGSSNHLLGTDELGRDMLTRLIYGGRMTLLIGFTPIILAFLIGTAIGLMSGFIGGKFNTIVMRTLDIFYAFPSVLLAVAISGAMGPGILNSIIALTIVFTPQIVRVAESAATQIRNLEYIDAARMSGANTLTIIRVHILSNVVGPIFVYATSLISVCMILASGLSFLGLGVKPPEPEWGLMLNTLRPAIYTKPFLAALPGIWLFIVSVSFNLLSDAFRQAMSKKS
jgi:peptide/nickel transport system permease protein